MYDVLIIGAGVTGCAAARYLSRYSLSIAVLEKAADVCDGTSKANTGIVHSGHDAEPGSNKAKYNRLGNLMYPELCRQLKVPFKNNGTIVLAFSDEQLARVDELVQQAKRNGIERVSRIDRDRLRELEPNVSERAVGALYAETGGTVCPYMMTVALAENAAANGAEFFLDAEVTSLKKTERGYIAETPKGAFEARAVVNCAGLWADEINNMVSAEKHHITARRGEYLILDKRWAGTFNSAIFQLPVDLPSGHTKGIVIAPTVDGTIMLGPTAQDTEKDALQNTEKGFAQVLEGAALSWDHIPRGDFISCFAGLRAHPETNDFVIGEAPDAENFYNCLGIESPGLTSAPAIGEHIAALIAQKLKAAEKPDWKPEREAKKPFREMTEAERAAAVKENPEYGVVVCRCETVTEAEVLAAIRGPVGAHTLDAVKRRTRAGMGRCQSGFCSTRVMELLAQELGVPLETITKSGAGSELVAGPLFDEEEAR